MRRLVTLALVLALFAPLSASGASSPSSPKRVLRSIVHAALAQKSLHWTATYSADLYGTATYTANVNKSSGTERVTGPGCSSGQRGSIRLLFIHHTVYVKGDVCGLEDSFNLNLTEAQATTYAGQWISVPRWGADRARYLTLAQGMTLASIVHAVTSPPGYVRLALFRRSHGTRLVFQGKSGPQDGRSWELTARAGGRPLLVALHWGGGCCEAPADSYRFSKWNKPVHVKAPASSTPIATVRAS